MLTSPTTLDLIKNEIGTLQALLMAKNSDYGDSALKFPPLVPGMRPGTAILIRMGDKIERLQTLTKNGLRCGETFEDTVRDLAGYCVMYLVSVASDKEDAAIEATLAPDAGTIPSGKKTSTTKTTPKASVPATSERVGRRTPRGKR